MKKKDHSRMAGDPFCLEFTNLLLYKDVNRFLFI